MLNKNQIKFKAAVENKTQISMIIALFGKHQILERVDSL